MARTSDEEAKRKKDAFINFYLNEAKGNGSLSAKMAGYAESRASQTAYDLLQDDYVKEKLRTYQNIQKETKTDGIGTISEIFESIGPIALNNLAQGARTDPALSKQLLELKLKYDNQRKEELGDYEGFSTDELIREFNKVNQEGQVLIQRIMETHRTGEMQKGSDISSESGVREQGPKEESVGQSPS